MTDIIFVVFLKNCMSERYGISVDEGFINVILILRIFILLLHAVKQ